MEIEQQDDNREMDDPDEWAGEHPASMDRLAILEDEVRMLKAALYTLPAALEKEKMEIRKSLDEFKAAQKRLSDLAATAVQSNQKVESLGRQVEGVKKDTSSWLVISIVCFSIFFVISLFIRAG
ncbi:MAG: hypothetical protein HQM00_12925 [Magnetococcales bacterium]|nr:hypothetical protein [Magnetococcales bacterium]